MGSSALTLMWWMRARGVRPWSASACSLTMSSEADASEICDATAAVPRPPSTRVGSERIFVPLGSPGPSSWLTSPTGAISLSKRLSARAPRARPWPPTANAPPSSPLQFHTPPPLPASRHWPPTPPPSPLPPRPYLALEAALRPGPEGPLVALHRERLHLVAADGPALGDHLGAAELADLTVAVALHPARRAGERVVEAEVGREGHRRADGDHRHLLDATRHDDVVHARHHRLRREVDGLLGRPALPVDGGAGHVLGQAGGEPACAGDVAGLATDGVDAAEHHVLDGGRGNHGPVTHPHGGVRYEDMWVPRCGAAPRGATVR